MEKLWQEGYTGGMLVQGNKCGNKEYERRGGRSMGCAKKMLGCMHPLLGMRDRTAGAGSASSMQGMVTGFVPDHTQRGGNNVYIPITKSWSDHLHSHPPHSPCRTRESHTRQLPSSCRTPLAHPRWWSWRALP